MTDDIYKVLCFIRLSRKPHRPHCKVICAFGILFVLIYIQLLK